MRNSKLCIALALPCVMFFAQHLKGAELEDRVIPYMNKHGISAGEREYAKKIRESANEAARHFYDDAKGMSIKQFEGIFKDSKLTADGRFLFVVFWLRVHSDSGADVLQVISAKHPKDLAEVANVQFVGDGSFSTIGREADSIFRKRLRLYKMQFPSSPSSSHHLFFSQVGGDADVEEGESSWWFQDDELLSRRDVRMPKLFLLRHIDRGWIATAKED